MDHFSVQSAPGSVVLSGEIDLHASTALRDALADAASDTGSTVEVDLSAVTFMDSSGFNELLRSASSGHEVRVTGVSSFVRRTMEMMGLDEVLRVEP